MRKAPKDRFSVRSIAGSYDRLLARNESLEQWFTPGTLARLVLEVTVTANMSIDELTRSYIAKIERQQHAQSTGLFRDRTERAPHFSAGMRFQSTSGGRIQYEERGPWMDGQSISSGCRASPTRLWLQFVSLATLGVLTAYMYLLAWAYYWRKKYGHSLETGVWVGIGFVVILLIGAVARPIFPWMGWTWAERLRTLLDSHPEHGIVMGWAVVALALVSICCNCESRDRLLGRGKGIALLAFTVLCVILGLSLLTA